MLNDKLSEEIKSQKYLVIEDYDDVPVMSDAIECWDSLEKAEDSAKRHEQFLENLKNPIPDIIWDSITDNLSGDHYNIDEIYNNLQSSIYANQYTRNDISQMIDYDNNMHKIGNVRYFVQPVDYFS